MHYFELSVLWHFTLLWCGYRGLFVKWPPSWAHSGPRVPNTSPNEPPGPPVGQPESEGNTAAACGEPGESICLSPLCEQGAAPTLGRHPQNITLSFCGPPPYSSDPSRPLWPWSRRLWAPSRSGEARRGRPEGALRKWVDASCRQHTGGGPVLFLCPGHRQDFAGRNWNKGIYISMSFVLVL